MKSRAKVSIQWIIVRIELLSLLFLDLIEDWTLGLSSLLRVRCAYVPKFIRAHVSLRSLDVCTGVLCVQYPDKASFRQRNLLLELELELALVCDICAQGK